MFLIRSGSIEGFEKLIAELDGNPLTLLRQAGLPGSRLRDFNNFVGFKQIVDLLEISGKECNEPLLGLLMSRRHNSSILGELAVYLFHQPTIRDALKAVNDHLYLHARGLSLGFSERDGNLSISMNVNFNTDLGMSQFMQLAVGHLTNYAAELLGQPTPLFPIYLQQRKPSQKSHLTDDKFLSKVRFNRPFNGISLPTSWLDGRPKINEAIIKPALKNGLEKLQTDYPDSIEDQIKEVIGQFLPFSECSLEKVASIMSIHPRTLQAKLSQQATSYNEVLQVTRLERAEHYLLRRRSITDIALLLGFSSVSVFSSAFKRWTGLSPKQWQKQHEKLK